MNKIFNSIIICFYTSLIMSQNNCPSKGQFIMIGEKIMTDEQLVDKSLNTKIPVFIKFYKNSIINAHIKENEPIDTIALTKMIEEKMYPTLMISYDPRKTKGVQQQYVYRFRDSVIESESFNSLQMSSDNVTVIHKDSGELELFIKKDSTLVKDYEALLTVKEEDVNILKSLKIFKDDVKNISGYKCFKVIAEYEVDISKNLMVKVFDNKEDFEELKQIFGSTKIEEYYVTDQIQCKYHPIVRSEKILNQFYPLEIRSKDEFIEGTEILFTTELIDIR